LLSPLKVWAVVDSAKSQDLAICQAYMEEWGIPLTNIISVPLGSLPSARTMEDWWTSVGSVVHAALPEDCEGIFCSPNSPELGVNASSPETVPQPGPNDTDLAVAPLLGHTKVFKAWLDYTGGLNSNYDNMRNHTKHCLKYIPDPQYTSSDGDSFGAPLETGDASWALMYADGNYSGSSTTSSAVDTSLLPAVISAGGLSTVDFRGIGESTYETTYWETYKRKTDTRIFIIDFDTFKIPVLNGGEETWDVIPSWRLGFRERGLAVANNRAMTPEDARALARRSKSTSGTILSRLEGSSAISHNDAGATVPLDAGKAWNSPSQFYFFEHLLSTLGMTNNKIGYHYTASSSRPWLWASNPDSIANVTGLSKYAQENMNYRYNVNFHNNLQPLNGTTFPIPVNNFFFDGINRNTAYYNNKDTDYQYFEPGTPHQLYNLSGGPVGFSTPSHSLGQGGEFIRAGGVAYYGSYAEPYADDSSDNGAIFFLNLLRGHQAAVAGLMLPGHSLLSQEEVLGDGLATPFQFERTNYQVGDPTLITGFTVTVGIYAVGQQLYGLTSGSAFAIGSVAPSVRTLLNGAQVSLYTCVYYVQSLASGNVPTVSMTLEADLGAVQNVDVSSFNSITIQNNGLNEITLVRADATYTTQTSTEDSSKELFSWVWEDVPTNPMGTTLGELREVQLRKA